MLRIIINKVKVLSRLRIKNLEVQGLLFFWFALGKLHWLHWWSFSKWDRLFDITHYYICSSLLFYHSNCIRSSATFIKTMMVKSSSDCNSIQNFKRSEQNLMSLKILSQQTLFVWLFQQSWLRTFKDGRFLLLY